VTVVRRVAGLHQQVEISSIPVKETYQPKTEGLDNVTTSRSVSSISIKLSKSPLDSSHYSYAPPLPSELVTGQQSSRQLTFTDLTKSQYQATQEVTQVNEQQATNVSEQRSEQPAFK